MASSSPDEKTYDDLQREAADKWRENTAQYGARLADMAKAFENSEDVRNRPAEGSRWQYSGVVCQCNGTEFVMRRYITINGVKHRTEVECTGCKKTMTWDFGSSAWLS